MRHLAFERRTGRHGLEMDTTNSPSGHKAVKRDGRAVRGCRGRSESELSVVAALLAPSVVSGLASQDSVIQQYKAMGAQAGL